MRYAKGVMWLDDTRIPFVDEVSIKISGDKKHLQKWKERDGRTPRDINEIENTPYENTKGRFTPNLLVCDDLLNDGVITSQSSGLRKNPGIKTQEWKAGHKKKYIMTTGDKGTNSRYYDLDTWFDKIIDNL